MQLNQAGSKAGCSVLLVQRIQTVDNSHFSCKVAYSFGHWNALMNSYDKLMQIYVKLEDWHIRQEIRANFYY